MNYHDDIRLYLEYDYKDFGFKVAKNFTDGDSLDDFEFKRKHIIVYSDDHEKILVNSNEIHRLIEEKIVNNCPVISSPTIPFFIPTLVTSFINFETYLLNVTTADITSYMRKFSTPKNIKLLKNVVFPLYGKIVTMTPDRFIISTPSGERVSVKRTKDVPLSLNDTVNIGVTYQSNKFTYVCLFCNITTRESSFNKGELSIFSLKFKEALFS